MNEHTLAQRQKDIEFSNLYRIEYIKHLITISSGMFVFTIAFMNDLINKPFECVTYKEVLIIGWLALVVSIIAGIYHMRHWAWYFNSWGRYPADKDEITWREKVNKHRRVAELTQFYLFFLGLGCLLVFAALNMY